MLPGNCHPSSELTSLVFRTFEYSVCVECEHSHDGEINGTHREYEKCKGKEDKTSGNMGECSKASCDGESGSNSTKVPIHRQKTASVAKEPGWMSLQQCRSANAGESGL